MRLGRLALLPTLLAAFLAMASATGRAQTSNSERKSQLEHEIHELTAEEAAAHEELAEIRDRKAVIDARVADLDAQLRDAGERVTRMDAEVERIDGELQGAQAKLVETEAQLAEAKAEISESAARIYRSARRGATFDYLTVERPFDLVHGTQYLDHVNARQRQTMRRVTVLRDDVAAHREAVATSKAQAHAAAAEAQRARDAIASLRTEIEPARVEAVAAADAETAQLAVLAARRAEAERELQAVSDAIAAELRAASGAFSGSLPAGGCDARPTRGTLTSGYGPRWGRLHAGVDIAARTGTTIHACWSGRVVIAGWQGGYGYTVVVDHGNGTATLYAHQSLIAVSVGQTVAAGALLGHVGSTGNSTGPHLHFEVRVNGNPVNPAPYL